jgi:hypothetical protein
VNCPKCGTLAAEIRRGVAAGYVQIRCRKDGWVAVREPAEEQKIVLDAIEPRAGRDENSQIAAAKIRGRPAAQQRRRFLALIREHGRLAAWEIEALLDVNSGVASGRINELHTHGFIVRVGKNLTPGGNPAWVYELTQAGRDELVATEAVGA